MRAPRSALPPAVPARRRDAGPPSRSPGHPPRSSQRRCTSIASAAVVQRPPSGRVSIGLSNPGRDPQPRDRARKHVVVLPFVPVMTATWSCATDGRRTRRPLSPWLPASATTSWGTVVKLLDDESAGPRSTASPGKAWPSSRRRGRRRRAFRGQRLASRMRARVSRRRRARDGRRSEHSTPLRVHAGRVYQRHSVVPEGADSQQKRAICGTFYHSDPGARLAAGLRSSRGGGGWRAFGLFRAVLTGRA